MPHLGLNAYFWGDREQDRLVVDCLAPLQDQLRRDALLERFWFDRFDARGPHVLAVFTVPESAVELARERIAAAVGSYIREHPSLAGLSADEVAKRHSECRGKILAVADREPGMAANNTWVLFEHAPGSYPFHLTRGLAAEEEIWRQADEVTRWAVRRIGESSAKPLAAAVSWAVEVDRNLRSPADGAESWRLHATTLLLPLRERLEADEAGTLSLLPSWIGERNGAAFSRLWSNPGVLEPETRAAVRRLVEIAYGLPGGPSGPRWRLLREMSHCTLKQLGLPVALHIPLVLFAWNHDLREASALR
jgi:hypothetical protein